MGNSIVHGYLSLLVVFLPAMTANGAPVVFKGKRPLDLGRNFLDGKRIFGDGKTIEGLTVGVLAGFVIGLVESLIAWNIFFAITGFIGGLSAMIGDLCGSFIKRRMGYERGEPVMVLDQLDFALCTTLAYYAYGLHMDPTSLLLVYVTIFLLHVTTNRLAFRLGLKDVPY
ncbi:MAG: CDP-2,3-bis-(O-geranylgeranyl)-sn-glycerol synthase [Desulfurococcales archaeon]|nr:CDP-2,3-bis-(O-geranylgeranyl)-sn-glycerol synthase [Desulfurococcales archaeon]